MPLGDCKDWTRRVGAVCTPPQAVLDSDWLSCCVVCMCDGRRPDGWWEDLTSEVNCSCTEWKNMHSTHTFVPIILKFDFKHLLAAQAFREPPQCFFPPPWWTQPHRVFHVFVLWRINNYTGTLKKSSINTLSYQSLETTCDIRFYNDHDLKHADCWFERTMTFIVRSSVLLSHPSTLTSSMLTLFVLEGSPKKLTHCEGEKILNN